MNFAWKVVMYVMIISASLNSVLAKKLFQTTRRLASVNPLSPIRARLYPHSQFYLPNSRLLSNLRSTPTDQIPNNSSPLPSDKDGQDLKGKIKEIWKEYGYLAVGTYFSIYLTTLGSIYACLEFDIFNAASFGLDPVYAIKKVKILFDAHL